MCTVYFLPQSRPLIPRTSPWMCHSLRGLEMYYTKNVENVNSWYGKKSFLTGEKKGHQVSIETFYQISACWCCYKTSSLIVLISHSWNSSQPGEDEVKILFFHGQFHNIYLSCASFLVDTLICIGM